MTEPVELLEYRNMWVSKWAVVSGLGQTYQPILPAITFNSLQLKCCSCFFMPKHSLHISHSKMLRSVYSVPVSLKPRLLVFVYTKHRSFTGFRPRADYGAASVIVLHSVITGWCFLCSHINNNDNQQKYHNNHTTMSKN